MSEVVNNSWQKGSAPVAVVMISLNEAHNLDSVLRNISGWAQEVFLVDSCSSDETVSIGLKYGITVVQRCFNGFGDQWNFALKTLPITAPWTMKLDPDERLSEELKSSINHLIKENRHDGIIVSRRLWFMGSTLPVSQSILRVWRSGTCYFTDVTVNEHPIIKGPTCRAKGYLEHRDSPDLDHWITKQNRYTTAEAINQYKRGELAFAPKFFGSIMENRMWFKKYFWFIPGRYSLLFFYHYIFLGAWRAGRVGLIWSILRVSVYRFWEYKRVEMEVLGRIPVRIPTGTGLPDPRVDFYK